MDNRRGTVLVSLDLSAAFDMVDHDRLIRRLSDCFGLTGVAVVGPVLLVEQRAVHQDQRPLFESNSDGIRNSSRFGIRTVPFFYLRVTSFQDHPGHGKIPSVCGRHATVLLHLHIRVHIGSYSTPGLCARCIGLVPNELHATERWQVRSTWRTGSQGWSKGNCRHRRFAYGIVRRHPEPRCSHGRSTQYGSACEFRLQFMLLPHQGSEAHSTFLEQGDCRQHRKKRCQLTPRLLQLVDVRDLQGEHEEAPTSSECLNPRHLFIGATWLCIRSPTGSALAPDRTADHFQDRCTHIQLSPEVGSTVSVWSCSRLSATSSVEIRRRGDPWSTTN